ncbi:hypothetical protein ABIA96_004011 [Bradyrhizobium sp. LB11.1]
MLISMPTGTSTIFGAFQAIRVSPSIERDIAPAKPRAASVTAQVWNRTTNTANWRVTRAQITLGQIAFAPSQAQPPSPQQSKERATGTRIQLLRIQRSILVRIRRVEALLDHGKIFVERQRTIMIGVGSGEFFRR